MHLQQCSQRCVLRYSSCLGMECISMFANATSSMTTFPRLSLYGHRWMSSRNGPAAWQTHCACVTKGYKHRVEMNLMNNMSTEIQEAVEPR